MLREREQVLQMPRGAQRTGQGTCRRAMFYARAGVKVLQKIQLMRAAISMLRPSGALVGGLYNCFFSWKTCISLAVLVVAILVFLVALHAYAPFDEQVFFATYGYRERAIAAQFPCPIYRGSPLEKDYLKGSESTYSFIGELTIVTERATGKMVSMYTTRVHSWEYVMSFWMRSLLLHHGLPGKVNVMAVYIESHYTHVVLECIPKTLSPLSLLKHTFDSSVLIPSLYRNVHNMFASGVTSDVYLGGSNFAFNTSSVPHSDPLVLYLDNPRLPPYYIRETPASALYRHVRSALYGPYYWADLGFLKLLQVLNDALEPTVAIFHSKTHFNVSDVHYCFEGQLELLSPGASRLLGLYQAAFAHQELQPWQDRVIMVHPLSTFGYPTVDYNSTYDGAFWDRMLFWDEPFSVCGRNSALFDGIHAVSLKFNSSENNAGSRAPCNS